jgi:glucose/arabinose dehydrogenase
MRRLVPGVVALAAALVMQFLPSGLAPASPAAAADPGLRVTTVASGLDHPWDVQPLPDGRLLITERTTKRLLLWDDGSVRRVSFPSSSVWASSETGLMSLAVDPGFTGNRRFYTCQGGYAGHGRHDVRVIAWRLSASGLSAASAGTLLKGIPASSGRHGGCRLLITNTGALLVGTGDAAIGRNPHTISSLGGKVLRLDRMTGKPWPYNPYVKSGSANARYVLTYGHRNVQGLAQRSDRTLWSVEQGTSRDDEVNLLARGGDYGWRPTPGYDESKPMTNFSLAGQQRGARWHSGYPTVATSGGTWVSGTQWKAFDGALAVAALKGERLMFMTFTSGGTLRRVATPSTLRGYGRLRSVTRVSGGDLLVTTDNGNHTDRVLRVHPTA